MNFKNLRMILLAVGILSYSFSERAAADSNLDHALDSLKSLEGDKMEDELPPGEKAIPIVKSAGTLAEEEATATRAKQLKLAQEKLASLEKEKEIGKKMLDNMAASMQRLTTTSTFGIQYRATLTNSGVRQINGIMGTYNEIKRDQDEILSKIDATKELVRHYSLTNAQVEVEQQKEILALDEQYRKQLRLEEELKQKRAGIQAELKSAGQGTTAQTQALGLQNQVDRELAAHSSTLSKIRANRESILKEVLPNASVRIGQAAEAAAVAEEQALAAEVRAQETAKQAKLAEEAAQERQRISDAAKAATDDMHAATAAGAQVQFAKDTATMEIAAKNAAEAAKRAKAAAAIAASGNDVKLAAQAASHAEEAAKASEAAQAGLHAQLIKDEIARAPADLAEAKIALGRATSKLSTAVDFLQSSKGIEARTKILIFGREAKGMLWANIGMFDSANYEISKLQDKIKILAEKAALANPGTGSSLVGSEAKKVAEKAELLNETEAGIRLKKLLADGFDAKAYNQEVLGNYRPAGVAALGPKEAAKISRQQAEKLRGELAEQTAQLEALKSEASGSAGAVAKAGSQLTKAPLSTKQEIERLVAEKKALVDAMEVARKDGQTVASRETMQRIRAELDSTQLALDKALKAGLVTQEIREGFLGFGSEFLSHGVLLRTVGLRAIGPVLAVGSLLAAFKASAAQSEKDRPIETFPVMRGAEGGSDLGGENVPVPAVGDVR